MAHTLLWAHNKPYEHTRALIKRFDPMWLHARRSGSIWAHVRPTWTQNASSKNAHTHYFVCSLITCKSEQGTQTHTYTNSFHLPMSGQVAGSNRSHIHTFAVDISIKELMPKVPEILIMMIVLPIDTKLTCTDPKGR